MCSVTANEVEPEKPSPYLAAAGWVNLMWGEEILRKFTGWALWP